MQAVQRDAQLGHLRRQFRRRAGWPRRRFSCGLEMLQLLTFAHQARAVKNHNQRAHVVQNRRRDRADGSKCCQREADNDETNAEHEVLVDDCARAA
jgi:hypothetical protein